MKAYFKIGIQWIIGIVFLYAGWIKIQNPVTFIESIAGFGLLPAFFITPLALILPLLEIAAGGLLIIGYGKCVGLLTICILTLIFAMAMGWALAKGLLVDCGCFGSGEISRGKMWVTLGKDILLFIGSSWMYREELWRRKECLKNENGGISYDLVATK